MDPGYEKGVLNGLAPLSARGNRSRSARTQPGAYVEKAFLNAPNQISTRRTPVDRASSTNPSTIEKSSCPSTGSVCSQDTGAITVLTPDVASLSQMGDM